MNKVTDDMVVKKYMQIRSSANSRYIEFNLTLTSIRNLLRAKKCYYTGVELTEVNSHENKRTIDRVNNNLGYVIGNVVACSNSFNQRKGNLTIEDIDILYKKTR